MSTTSNKKQQQKGARTGRAVVRLARHHPLAALAGPVAGLVAWRLGAVVLTGILVLVALVLVGWWWRLPTSFQTLVGRRARSAWRREWTYGRQWREAMFLVGLAAWFDGAEVVPTLGRVRSTWATDTVAVREPLGQDPFDWEQAAPTLSESFGALSCRVCRVKPGRVELVFTTRRHEGVVPALPIPSVDELDLEAVPVGRRGDGETWGLPLRERNIEVAGGQGSGKTEGVLWSLIRALGSWIGAGRAVIWAGDPKGGTGLAHGSIVDGEPGCPLFTRFARTEAQVCELIFDGCEEMYRREDSLRRAGARRWTPTDDSPLIVLVVDELLSITTLLPDRELARQAEAALKLLMSRARAVGIVVVAATQDPRDRHNPFADLTQVKVCMRLARAALVDVVLGQGAHAAGAHAERIPSGDKGAGQAYVVSEDDGDAGAPMWVRASQVTRALADEMGAEYPTPWTWDDNQHVMVRHIPAADAEVVDITGRRAVALGAAG